MSRDDNPRLNGAMRALVSDVDQRSLPPLPAALEAVVGGGVTADGDALVLAALRSPTLPAPAALGDVTGYEAFVNHVHIDEHGDVSSPATLVALGLAYARRLEELLRQQRRPTQIVLAVDGTAAAVRFVTRRAGQPYLADDLEGYRDEAILVIDVG